jgi:YHS domain-containing protein
MIIIENEVNKPGTLILKGKKMNIQSRKIIPFGAIVILLLVAAVVINGCKKSEPQTTTGHEGHDHAATTDKPAEMIEAAKEVVSKANEQKTCPIMGGPINKDVFTEYKGKKVYFCCPGCEGKFAENPEQYIAKLPQFNK